MLNVVRFLGKSISFCDFCFDCVSGGQTADESEANSLHE